MLHIFGNLLVKGAAEAIKLTAKGVDNVSQNIADANDAALARKRANETSMERMRRERDERLKRQGL